jgi:CDP-glucose 4,6-dehydratase
LKKFNNKTILVTGHTGFKGSWLSIWLTSMGAKVVGLSDKIPTEPSNFIMSKVNNLVEDNRVDIRNKKEVEKVIQKCQPDFIFHLAAQALVRSSYESPFETIEVNSMGSVNILEGIRGLKKSVVLVMITSDKVYDNVEWIWGYRETDRLGGKDPYSASKGIAELAIRTYVESFFNENSNVRIGVARAGNVIGGGDWASNRIVPDCMRAWSIGKVVDIRNPYATRPWQHVLEPLSGYLALAIDLKNSNKRHGEAFNFGPSILQDFNVSELIDEMAKYWDKVSWKDTSSSENHVHEAGLLKLNCDKSLHDLHWQSTLDFEKTIKMTVEWYKTFYQNDQSSMYDFTIKQINDYVKIAQSKNLLWANYD